METPKEYYYTYYSYEEWGRGYFGSRKCKCLPEEDVKYFGSFSDKTFKPTQKIILKNDYATREEAYADEIILQQYYKVVENPHFANKSYQTSTKFYYSQSLSSEEAKRRGQISRDSGKGFHSFTKEQKIECGKKSGQRTYEMGKGIHGLTTEQRRENGKKSGKKIKELRLGFFKLTPEETKENARKGGKISSELKLGLHSLTKEEKSELGKKGAKKQKELNIGLFGLTTEQRRETVKKTNSQRWQCLETGYISTPSGLTIYQRKRNIDTSKRKRIL